MRKYYFILVFFISIFSMQAADLNLSPPIITGNFSICLPGITTTQFAVSGGSGIPDPTNPWVSSNLNVATVDNNVSETDHVVIFVTPSGAVGYCYGGAFSCQSTSPCPEAGVLSGVQNICVGNSTSFTSTVAGGTWSSSNTNVATVNPTTGVVTGVTAGTATMTYTVLGTGGCPNVSSLRTVSVSADAVAANLQGFQGICVGTHTVYVADQPGGTWTSSNMLIATVDSTGFVLGISPGVATIYYTLPGSGGCSNVTSSRSVVVSAAPSLVLTSQPATSSQTVCINSPIATISYGTNGFIQDVFSQGLPEGIVGVYSSGNYTISGTPTSAGVYPYTVIAVGPCGDASYSGTVSVLSTSTTLFCDSNNLPPNSVGFDWAPVVGATDYNVSYSINGGPTQTANSIVSNYQVSGVLPGQSVLFTVVSASGANCFVPVSTTCTLLANSDFDADAISVYPNPVQDILYIKDLKFTSDISLFNTFGQEVYSLKEVSNNCNIPMSVLADGFYLVKITAQEQTKTIKVVKN
ncbi:T9SS type A sorting domain-containing protein [Flavobacterium sp. CYK-55]|uniref:T9SS type A sorting domain-containing protein n=1 Tax=Flavobacterium sp. CYK-55 TaxID=2835529 RepID=UPI001BCD3B05|nr:T9SS type A sorting domain-containing protein [Flavobacterium sp. CYK-55]MBS7788265.1 T9SS type A sorting domain-containing protein [Flavobacterium sp. CYK-55]